MNQVRAASTNRPVAPKRSTTCGRCGAKLRLEKGTCLSCLLLQGLEAEGEASSEAFASVLAEVDLPDKEWRLGNYEILEEIGRGGMGVIYRAKQRHSRRIVAVKRMLSYDTSSHETLVRFRREAETASSLDHPNILPIYEVSESEEGVPFFSMKLAAGGSLRGAAPSLSGKPRKCVQLMAKIARALENAHQREILHRDLQPGNILLDARGEPMISDFGLAKWREDPSDLTRTLTTFGTPGYIAPEQAEGAAQITSAADIYSLGAILFNLLARRPPFVGANALSVIRQATATDAPRLRSLVPSISHDLETIVAHCLERDPHARDQSAGDLAEDLDRWVENRPILARPVPALTRALRWSLRNPLLAITAAACILLMGVVGALLLRQHIVGVSDIDPLGKVRDMAPYNLDPHRKQQAERWNAVLKRAAAVAASRPNDARAVIFLGELNAAMGRAPEALRSAERALELLELNPKAIDRASMLCRVAGIYAQLGRNSRSLDLLARAVKLPNGPNYDYLARDERWNSLRGEPRFAEILQSIPPKTAP